ncbi:Kelch-like protein 20 [Tetrabaena socialis]|uniref:Kelch-like protein 20 n=1 Tax=Tetrabaena socialis TaxID=47790 RepID=A0A2J7ZLV9_9CHLO|nr:Kelch-like protein 20 [Tetrabaena socialis]|eukprot:PNH01245.1 Kelch-like protein 20 [Tetrabaena socialis]
MKTWRMAFLAASHERDCFSFIDLGFIFLVDATFLRDYDVVPVPIPEGTVIPLMRCNLLTFELTFDWNDVPYSIPSKAGETSRTLRGDLLALLERQPDGTADVVLIAGPDRHHVHRALLSARCDYYRHLFQSDFADARATEFIVPDDPAAVRIFVRFLYSDDADIPADNAIAVTEMANRLLVPKLFELGVAAVVASLSASNIAGIRVWANRRGYSALSTKLDTWVEA